MVITRWPTASGPSGIGTALTVELHAEQKRLAHSANGRGHWEPGLVLGRDVRHWSQLDRVMTGS